MAKKAQVAICYISGGKSIEISSIARLLMNVGITSEAVNISNIYSKYGSNIANTKAYMVANYDAIIMYDGNPVTATPSDLFYNMVNYTAGDTIPMVISGGIFKSGSKPFTTDANFPVVPYNGSDATTFTQTNDLAGTYAGTSSEGKELGTALEFVNTGITPNQSEDDPLRNKVWGRFHSYFWDTGACATAIMRVDNSKLAASDSEVLAIPDAFIMGLSPETDGRTSCYILRYHNRIFIPNLCMKSNMRAGGDLNVTQYNWAYGLILWAFAYLYDTGRSTVNKRFPIRITYQEDHPIVNPGGQAYLEQGFQNCYQTHNYLRAFGKKTGLQMCIGITSGDIFRSANVASSPQQYYDLINYASINGYNRLAHNLFVDEHNKNGSLVFCQHDHTIDNQTDPQNKNGLGASHTLTNFKRHNSAGAYYGLRSGLPSNYAAPVNVTGFGTAVQASVVSNTLDFYKTLLEGNHVEMLVMGFNDSICGNQKHLNFGYNAPGTPEQVDWLCKNPIISGQINTRIASLRIQYKGGEPTGSPVAYNHNNGTRNMMYGRDVRFWRHPETGVEFFNSNDLLANYYGGLHTSWNGQTTIKTGLSLTGTTEIVTYKQLMAYGIDFMLYWAIVHNTIWFTHGNHCCYADPTKPLTRYLESGTFNGILELIWGLDDWVNCLRGWVTWGSVTDLIGWRNNMRSYWGGLAH